MLKSALIAVTLGAALSGSPAHAADDGGIPGPRTCFWSRGPVSGDPYINIAYPDSHTFYWSAAFTVPAGARLNLAGQFPHSRYMSFISYDQDGRPIEALADYLIAPEKGSANPFLPGANRNSANRNYSIDVVDRPGSNAILEGIQQPGAQRQQLSTPKYGAGQQVVIYRIYASDKRFPVTGGAGLPEPILTMADGSTLRGAAACAAMKTKQTPQISAAALGIPVPQYRQLTSLPGKPDTWPALPQPAWHIQLDRKSLIGIYTGEIDPNARRSEGGFYPNPDNNYIRAIVNLRFGPVIVLRAKAPTTPRTSDGQANSGTSQLRYWSLCSNQGFANTRVTDCLYDEQVPVDDTGHFTIVVSKAKDRPRNARPECGIAWLRIADDGDGVLDKDVAVIQFRHMLAAPDFAQAIQRIPNDDAIGTTMGDYAPKAFYTMPNVVETSFPCGT